MSFKEALRSVQQAVNQDLQTFFRAKQKEAQNIHPHGVDLVYQVADLTLRGGKRTRPFLCWLGHKTILNIKYQISNINIKNQKERKLETVHLPGSLLNAMIALELFQTFALIHDDIIDQDKERRGGPTVHEHFRLAYHLSPITYPKAKHFGESMAILAGDLAFAWAVELIGQTKNEAARALFLRMASETILGQGLDVLRVQAGEEIDKVYIDEFKTAYYSVARPLELGAMLAGGSETTFGALKHWGLAVGRAFQLRDDFLDGQISQEKFSHQVKPHLVTAEAAAVKLALPEELHQLYRDFAQFVVKRQS